MLYCFQCFSQNSLDKDLKVKLQSWNAESCDSTYDPYKLISRITDWIVKDGVSTITVNFSDNCCVEFDPTVTFRNDTLKLLPYAEYLGDYCSCDCCFSISFKIEGPINKNTIVYFKGQEIQVSDEHYATSEPTFSLDHGNKINRVNKYGFQEGTWIDRYDDGTLKSKHVFPENSLYFESESIWSKGYYPSGKLAYHDRKDTSEYWFDDGELKHQAIKYYSGDTIFERTITKYDNRQVRQNSLERYYPTVFKSDYDSTYKGKGSIFDYLYREEYYSNGQPKYLQKEDTCYTWFEGGNIKLKTYHSGSMHYNEENELVKKAFHWERPNPFGGGDLPHSIYVHYFENGVIKEVHHVRDEPSEDGKSVGVGIHYHWKWDKEQKLKSSPNEWEEELPWIKFEEIKLSPTNADE